MSHVPHLSGAGQSREQRVLAGLPLLLAVGAHRSAFGKAAGSAHSAIEVEGHPVQPEALQPVRDQLSIELA